MENASKALLMAASVLIGIMILTLAVFLFVSFGNTAKEKYEENKQQQIAQFNAQFTQYEGKECTIYDVVTLINLATENNKYYGYNKTNTVCDGTNSYISIVLDNVSKEYGTESANSKIISENDDLIKNHNTYWDEGEQAQLLQKYKIVETKISEHTNKIYKVRFATIEQN